MMLLDDVYSDFADENFMDIFDIFDDDEDFAEYKLVHMKLALYRDMYPQDKFPYEEFKLKDGRLYHCPSRWVSNIMVEI